MGKAQELVIIMVGVLVISGCAGVSNVPITSEAASSIKNRVITLAVHETPSFRAVTRGKSQFLLLGIAAVYTHGNQIITENNIDDPAKNIGEKLVLQLRDKYETEIAPIRVFVINDDIQDISKKNSGLDLLLDIKTTNWAFAYYLTSLSKYRVLYSAQLRLIDMKKGEILAEGLCERNPDQTSNSPTYDELLDNNAEGLKNELREAEEFCAGEFWGKVFQF